MAPVAVNHKEHEKQFILEPFPPIKPPRISEEERYFGEGIHPRWTEEVFTISLVLSYVQLTFYDLFIHLLKGFNKVLDRGENIVSRVKVSLVLIIHLTCLVNFHCAAIHLLFDPFYPFNAQSSISSTLDTRETSR